MDLGMPSFETTSNKRITNSSAVISTTYCSTNISWHKEKHVVEHWLRIVEIYGACCDACCSEDMSHLTLQVSSFE